MSTPGDLALTPETEGRLWTVRTWANMYLVVRRMDDKYDVHRIDGANVEYVGEAHGQVEALAAICTDLNEN